MERTSSAFWALGLVVAALLACRGTSDTERRAQRERVQLELERMRLAKESEEVDRKRREVEEAESRRKAALTLYGAMTPKQRAAELRKCILGTCGDADALIIEAAPNDAERRKLSSLRDQLLVEKQRKERAKENARRTQEREAVGRPTGARPLLCRDGTPSPTCVCGGPRRGCCSHHGGVMGCME